MRLSNGKMIPLSGIYLTVNALGGNATTSGRNAVANATQAAASGGVAIVNRSVVGPFPANEPAVAVDPNNSAHIIASANDYRFGDSQEGLYSALAGPFSFTDTVVQYVNSGPYYYNAAGDPSTGIDRSGTDYFGMLAFDRTTPGRSAVIVARSLPSATGLFVNRIPVAIDQQAATSGIFDDKDSLAVDNVLGSPSSGSIYSAFTQFVPGSSPIVAAFSRSQGATFATPVLVSKPGGAALCPFDAGACADDQASTIGVGPKGIVYIAYENFDTVTCRTRFSSRPLSTAARPSARPPRSATTMTSPIRMERSASIAFRISPSTR